MEATKSRINEKIVAREPEIKLPKGRWKTKATQIKEKAKIVAEVIEL